LFIYNLVEKIKDIVYVKNYKILTLKIIYKIRINKVLNIFIRNIRFNQAKSLSDDLFIITTSAAYVAASI
jgi:hypothetical protein